MQIPSNVARAVDYAKTLGTVILCLFIIYTVVKDTIRSWFGMVYWGIFFAGCVWWVWRKAEEHARKRQFDAHLDAEQLSAIVKLREIVADVEAHTEPNRPWKVYFTRRYWMPEEPPPKPSLDEIESIFKECEAAVDPDDANVHLAMNKLLWASRAQKDMELEGMVIKKYGPFVERKQGKDSEILIRLHARAGQLHFTKGNYDVSAEELRRALDLHRLHQQRDPHCRDLMTHALFLYCKIVLALSYTMAKNFDAAETATVELLPMLEQEEGVLNIEPLGTQSIRAMLIGIYIKQGWKALNTAKDGASSTTATRYLRDALHLTAVHSLFYAHNLKQVGRLFIWTGRINDGNMAFRLANTVFEAGKRSGIPQSNCLCADPKEERHGLRSCDACEKKIGLDDTWFFCRTCMDVDLCTGCYVGFEKSEEGGWEDVEKFPRECLEHEFFEVRADEREEGVSAHLWMAEVTQRLTNEIERGTPVLLSKCN